MPAPNDGDDFVGVGGPGKGLGLLIVLFEKSVDRGLEVDDGAKHATLKPALGEGREEALDGVERSIGMAIVTDLGYRNS